MKKLFIALLAMGSISVFAQVREVKCTLSNVKDNKTINVKVSSESSGLIKSSTVSLLNFDNTITKISIHASYNGTSDGLKPSTKSKYTLSVLAKKSSAFNGNFKYLSGVLLFSADFPLSGTILGGVENSHDEELTDSSTITISCVNK